jgi:ribosomal protein L29
MDRKIEDMTVEELRAELKRLKEYLFDLEDTHAFTFGKTTVHIGAEQAENMQKEYEEEYRADRQRIARIQGLLNAGDAR